MNRSKKKNTRIKQWVSLGDQYDMRIGHQINSKLFAVQLKESTERIDILLHSSFEPTISDRIRTTPSLDHILSGFPYPIEPINLAIHDYFSNTNFNFLSPYTLEKCSRLVQLQKEIQKLQDEVKTNRCFEIISQIRKLVQELRAVTLRHISKAGSVLRSLELTLLFGYKINRIVFFRRLIQFLFKNMDDESGDASLAYSILASNLNNNRFNLYPYGFQRARIG